MNTIAGIFVYGLVFIMIVVGFIKMFFDGIIDFLGTVLNYGLKIAAVIIIISFVYGMVSKKE